jgi:hypothetical protein
MDPSAYQTWWALHVRTCRDEPLSEAEHATYAAGLKELHAQEVLANDPASLRQARQAVLDLDTKCDELQARRRQLRRDMSRLEAALSQETRRRLGIEE